MKVTIDENDRNFYIQFQPENIEELSLLARICMNTTRELPMAPSVYMSEKPTASLILGRAANAETSIEKKWS